MYFLDDVCVRIGAIDVDGSNGIMKTARGIHLWSTYSQMVDLYRDFFETHDRYSVNNCICEFGMQGDDSNYIYNVEIYIPSQVPINDYGEELIN